MSSSVPTNPGAYRLQKTDKVIYVGSAKNLQDRYSDWQTNPQNPCVRSTGWDKFVWKVTPTLDAARKLELDWFNRFQPTCNEITPPG